MNYYKHNKWKMKERLDETARILHSALKWESQSVWFPLFSSRLNFFSLNMFIENFHDPFIQLFPYPFSPTLLLLKLTCNIYFSFPQMFGAFFRPKCRTKNGTYVISQMLCLESNAISNLLTQNKGSHLVYTYILFCSP